MLTRQIKRYGWRPDTPDFRDHLFLRNRSVALPPSVDLTTTPFSPEPYDQGQLGSCTANGIARVIQFQRRKQGLPDFTPSRLMIYYDERMAEGTIDQDAGAEIRDGIKSMASQGACPEALWPYDITKFSMKPPNAAYTAAIKDRAVEYQRIDNSDCDAIKQALVEGHPVVFGMTVYETFEKVGADGHVPMPRFTDDALGGHCMVIEGYDDNVHNDGVVEFALAHGAGCFLVTNSWGPGWARGGRCWIPYSYLTNTNLATDFWKVTLVSTDAP